MRRAGYVDILKALCAFLVVCIHAPFPGIVGDYFTALSRVAVPIFFMITGYYYAYTVKQNKSINQIIKIFKLLIMGNALYFIWKIVIMLITGNNILLFLQKTFTVNNLLKFLVFNESPLGGHLWYIGAILYVLIIILVAEWLNFTKILYYFIPIFLLGNLIFGKYSILVFGKEFPVYLTRNYLFVGLPYFLIGALIKQKIIDRKVFNWRGLNPYMVILFILTTLIERWLLVNFSVNATRDDYLSTTFLAIALFGLFFSYHYDDCKSNEKKVRIMLAEIGRYYSSWIYILHPIFITVIVDIVSKLNMYSKYIYVAPVVVYIVT